MEIDKELLLKLEHLAKLELSESERTEIAGDLNNILKMVEKLQEVNTDGVEPLTHITEVNNIFRKDEVKNELTQEDALKNAPDHNDEFFKVPKVIKK